MTKDELILKLCDRIYLCFEVIRDVAERKVTKKILEHEGVKYLRLIKPAHDKVLVDPVNGMLGIYIDVYSVLEAFGVTCPARQHAIKKLLCAGLRGKGTEIQDLIGVEAALSRAIELQHARDANERVESSAVQTPAHDTADGRQSGRVPPGRGTGPVEDQALVRDPRTTPPGNDREGPGSRGGDRTAQTDGDHGEVPSPDELELYKRKWREFAGAAGSIDSERLDGIRQSVNDAVDRAQEYRPGVASGSGPFQPGPRGD